MPTCDASYCTFPYWEAPKPEGQQEPVPSEQAVTDAMVERVIEAICDQLIGAKVDYPAGYEAGHRISFDDDKMRTALKAAMEEGR